MKRSCKFSMYPCDLGFFVRSVGDFNMEAMERQRIKTAHFGEIFWGLEGRGVFRAANKKEYVLRPGWVWYYPPGSVHVYRPDHCRFHYRWLTIDGPEAERLFAALKITSGLHYAGSCPEALFDDIYRKLAEPDTQLDVLSTAFSILTRVVRGSRGAGRTDRVTADAIKNFIDEMFPDPDFSVTTIADHLGVHRTTINRNFKMVYNVDVSAYIKSCRLQEALRLIHSTTLPIAEIAQRTGFSSSNYCIRMIRRITGSTPGQLRRGNNLHLQ